MGLHFIMFLFELFVFGFKKKEFTRSVTKHTFNMFSKYKRSATSICSCAQVKRASTEQLVNYSKEPTSIIYLLKRVFFSLKSRLIVSQ